MNYGNWLVWLLWFLIRIYGKFKSSFREAHDTFCKIIWVKKNINTQTKTHAEIETVVIHSRCIRNFRDAGLPRIFKISQASIAETIWFVYTSTGNLVEITSGGSYRRFKPLVSGKHWPKQLTMFRFEECFGETLPETRENFRNLFSGKHLLTVL